MLMDRSIGTLSERRELFFPNAFFTTAGSFYPLDPGVLKSISLGLSVLFRYDQNKTGEPSF